MAQYSATIIDSNNLQKSHRLEMFKMRTSVLIVLSFVLSPLVASAHTLRVPDDFELIQQAINASVTGDTILVAPGLHVDANIMCI